MSENRILAFVSDIYTPTNGEMISHTVISITLATLLLNQVVLMDAVAPEALEQSAEVVYIASYAIVFYGVLPPARMVGSAIMKLAEWYVVDSDDSGGEPA